MKYLQAFLFSVVTMTRSLSDAQNTTTAATTTTTTTTTVTTTTAQIANCPNDWLDADFLGCYKFLEAKVNLSWVEAQHSCELAGGYLAEPTTARQAEFLHGLALLEQDLYGIGYWYIGLTDLGKEGSWVWIHSGEQLTVAFWGVNRPRNKTGNAEDCGVMVLKNNDFVWEDQSCLVPEIQHHPVAPVCQRDTSASSTTVQPETTTVYGCPSTWSEFNGNCYKFFSIREYWVTAEFRCVAEGGRLVSIHSLAEEQFLNNLSGRTAYWIGGLYLNRDGAKYAWSDGSAWDYEQIYDVSTGECMFQDFNYGGWRSGNCHSSSYSFSYICKI